MKLTSKGKNIKLSLGASLTLAAVLIFLAELYLGFNFYYDNFLKHPEQAQTSGIIRLDSTTYKNTIQTLNGLNTYVPNNPAPLNSNPFK